MKKNLFIALILLTIAGDLHAQRRELKWERVAAPGTANSLAGWDDDGEPAEISGSEATLLLTTFTSSSKGLVPASGGGTTTFLRADGTFAAPSGGISGLTTNRIPYATSATTIGDDAQLTWNPTSNALGLSGVLLFATGTNTFFGGGNFTLTGGGNSGFGAGAGGDLTSGINNVLVGYNSGESVTSGNLNTAMGPYSLYSVTSGSQNTAIGSNALFNATGSNNVAIGSSAGENITSGSDNVVIGQNVGVQDPTGNGQLTIQRAIFGAGNNPGAGQTTIASGNIGFYATTWGTNAQRVISIGNGTAPTTAITDGIQIYAEDTGDGASTLGLFTEQDVEDIGTFTASHKLKIVVNGVEYWVQLEAVTP